MKTIKDILDFCNRAIFFDYNNPGCIEDFNSVRKFIINRFHESIPDSRIIFNLSIIDEMLLKIFNNEIDSILNDIHNLRENMMYMISFEKTVNDEKEFESESDED